MQKFRIRYKPFPAELHGEICGMVGGKPGGMLTVLIDSTLSDEEQKRTLKHELAHIFLEHLNQEDRTYKDVEAEADAAAARMTDTELEALLKLASA